jgi:alpha-galactosidase
MTSAILLFCRGLPKRGFPSTPIGMLMTVYLFLALSHAPSCGETAFNYSGQLADSGKPAEGLYDLRFRLMSAAKGGIELGVCNVTLIPVSSGKFTTVLRFDPTLFTGEPRWLELHVRTNGSEVFSVLQPRQLVGTVPAAVVAQIAQNAQHATIADNLTGGGAVLTNIDGASIKPGSITAVQLAPGAVTAAFPVATTTNSGLLSSNLMVQMGIAPSFFSSVAPVPPMGWNSWAAGYSSELSEEAIIAIAEYVVSHGLDKIGYEYVNLDDGWAGYRKPDGNLEANTNRFPHGIKWLIDYVHSRGLKIGLYFVMGPQTNLRTPGSHGYWEQDAAYFAGLGVDYVKLSYDSGNESWPEVYDLYQRFIAAWQATGKPAFMNASVHHFEPWMARTLNSWHYVCQGDANGSFMNMLMRLDCCSPFTFAVSQGHWIDADFIFIRTQTAQEYRVEFGMHALLAGQILLPGFPAKAMEVLTNAAVIAVLKDPAGIPGYVAATGPSKSYQVWVRPLGSLTGDTKAVGVLNRSLNQTLDVPIRWNDIGLAEGPATVVDLWARSTIAFATNSYTVRVPPASLALFKISSGVCSPFAPGLNYLSDQQWLAGMTNGLWTNNVQWYPPFMNKNHDGSPLTLQGRVYARGVSLAAAGHIEYFLGGRVHSFYAVIGLDDHYNNCGKAKVLISVDNKLVFDSGTLEPGASPKVARIPLKGGQVMAIETLSLTPAPGTWHVTFGDARFVVDDSLEAANTDLQLSMSDAALQDDSTDLPLFSQIFRTRAVNGQVSFLGTRCAVLSIQGIANATASISTGSAEAPAAFTANGDSPDQINWSSRFKIACSFSVGGTAAPLAPGSHFKFVVGAAPEANNAALADKAIGFELDGNYELHVLVHDGATLKRHATGISLVPSGLTKHTIALTSNGAGQVSLWIDGEPTSTWDGAPVGQSRAFHTAIVGELANGAEAAAAKVFIHSVRVGWAP